MAATASGAPHLTLTIPPGALVAPTTITATPVVGIGSTERQVLGLQLAPGGLTLLQPALLEVAPVPGAPVRARDLGWLDVARFFSEVGHTSGGCPDVPIDELWEVGFDTNAAVVTVTWNDEESSGEVGAR